MSLETNLKEAFERRATDVESGPEAWPGLRTHLARAHSRRVTATIVLSIAIVSTLGLGIVRLTGSAPGSFANDPASLRGVRYEQTFDVTYNNQSADLYTVSGRVDFSTGRISQTQTSPGGELEIIYAAEATYVRLPEPVDGKEWGRVEGSDAFAASLRPRLLSPFFDPAGYVQTVRDVSSKERDLGPETIRGIELTHLRMILDPEAARKAAPSTEREFYRGIKAMRMDLWVGEDGLVHRVMSTWTGAARDDEVSSSSVMDLFDYGRPVRIDLPAPEQTLEIESVLDLFLGRTTSATFECTGTSITPSSDGGTTTTTTTDC
jgi:hypothetical protein